MTVPSHEKPVPYDDVELRLLERRRDLVLHDLHADAVADRLDAFLQRLDAADVEADRRVELQRAAARRRLRVAEHDADLLAQLVREQADRVGAVERARELAERLRHEARLEADVRVAHLALDLGLRRERCDRVDRDDVERTRADEELRDLERLLAGIGLRDEEVVDVDADALRVLRVHRVLGVDERADAAAALRLGDHVVDERRLTGRLRAEHLDDAPARQPADPRAQGRAPDDPVDTAPIETAARSFIFMTDPLPNCRSIWPSATSRASCLSTYLSLLEQQSMTTSYRAPAGAQP